jgi:methyl-accepting chemotaxis protein
MILATSLKAKLLAGFAVVLAMMAGMAGVACWQIRSADVAADEIASNYLLSIEDLGRMDACANKLRRLQYGHILAEGPDAKRKYEQDIETCIAVFRTSMTRYQTFEMDEEERTLRETAQRRWESLVQGNAAVLAPSQAGRRDEAFARMTEMRTDSNACLEALGRLIAINVKEAEEAKSDQDRLVTHAYLTILGSTLVALVVGMVVALRLARGITMPVQAVAGSLTALAEGDLTRQVAVTTRDEIGTMAGTLNHTQDSLRGMVVVIGRNAQGIAGASEELTAVSTQVSGNAETAAGQAAHAAAAAAQVAASIATCATGITEMGASVGEIAENAGQAAAIAQQGVAAAKEADAAVGRLGVSSGEIGDIIAVITGIAEQTNLLALNAAIEAASAGDAGRGFAVVAAEVKALAGKTAAATADIGKRVHAIQGDATAAQQALQRISGIVDRISTLQNAIAAAVEQQSATTKEIGGNIDQVAKAGNDISHSIASVASAAKESSGGAAETLKSATELARLAAELRSAVERFRI